MTPTQFSWIFLATLLFTTLAKFWLARRHLHYIAAHRSSVPAAFSSSIALSEHQKAADYTSAKTRFAMGKLLFDALLLWGFTLGGGMQWVAEVCNAQFAAPLLQGMVTVVAVLLLSSVLEMPFDWYNTFILESRFGFNKMTVRLYLQDTVKSWLVGMVLGMPLLWSVLWMMGRMGELWWLYVWVTWVIFNLLVLLIYPTFIAPLFNKFQPLSASEMKTRIEALLHRCGFTAQGLFVMDGSKRSAHGNAYFTGFGQSKRIVFFDTLLDRLSISEVEAVLAHELGHFKHRHIVKRMVLIFTLSLAFLWLLGELMQTAWFYQGLGVTQPSTALALLLFFMVLPLFSFWFNPLMSAYSRKHEFEADAYAAQQTGSQDLIQALVKLYQDNAATLTPDPLYSQFYDSHPPAAVRIAHLQSCA